jgi:hypothetical protein
MALAAADFEFKLRGRHELRKSHCRLAGIRHRPKQGRAFGVLRAAAHMHRDMVKGAKTGIRMAEQEVENGKDPEVRVLAEKILDGQQKEAEELDPLSNAAPALQASSRLRQPGGNP